MIIGSDEVNSQVFKIKDMDEKVEHTYNLLELEGYLSNDK